MHRDCVTLFEVGGVTVCKLDEKGNGESCCEL
jgi:hypothetical protein